ncbi:MAG: transcription elongation factor GreA [Bacillales bacterium]|nr:transcription elongation factor GreA [Bacillales bacterium]
MKDEEIIVTKEGFRKLNEELRNLIDVVLPEVIEQLKEARAQGDLSENADYDAARNRQAEVEGRIAQLQHQIENAKVIDEVSGKSNVVRIGCFVTIRDLSDNSETRYQIVGSTESDPENCKISNECMLAKSILNHKVGEKVQVKVVRPYDVEILKVEAE